jgi:para-aminobenzoate synthetase/4-amino-4-deoxychorismate lyase
MTPADLPRQAPERHAEEPGALSETFVLLDNNSGGGPPSLLFSEPVEIVSAETPEEVPAALARIEAAVESGLHAAGFFAYELGYVLEPKLSALMPEKRNVPLLWIGLYKAPAEMTSA